MSRGSFERFRQIVLASAELQARLRQIEDTDEFVTAVVRLAGAQGLEVVEMDVRDAMNAGRRAWLERWI